ncbi:ribosomal RNA large subunit methyltransferase I [Dictyobacter alpinus]|uniref:Ribosomal RNA large subunit methyltransferase I n=1 Tax=Dictyobacter alpinus TaxID=2014873 RepID=A0A402BAN7_9CHLR|nr:class I SAM-dependent rRNA methyltransferase [Dictyobacter alpinus]GCE28362.1 ribosomal RNA large subunit methyltransferase I [Dictyobacter alpinus]
MTSAIHYPATSLKPRRDESLQSGHLWIFSGALQQAPHWVENGGILDVKSDTGKFIARGYYNANTDIAIRILTHDPDEAIDSDFLRRRIRSAMQLREVFEPEVTNAYRLINSEGDGLPGLVVDRYADILVAQIHTAGMEQLRPLVIEALMQETGARGILLRNDSQSRRREGLFVQEPVVVAGEVPAQAEVRENGVSFFIDFWEGQKTGFFLDQRDKRESLRKYTRGKRVLNCFSYTAGFSVYAALNNPPAQTTSVDISEPAIDAAKQIFAMNGLNPDDHEFIVSDVFEYLEAAWKRGELFDSVILDPPAFAKTQGARTHALKAYRRLNYLGMQVLKPGGLLLTCSCSGVIGMDDLLGTISVSAQRLHRPVQVLESYTHGLDHPINIAMPETAYLKAVFCRIS